MTQVIRSARLFDGRQFFDNAAVVLEGALVQRVGPWSRTAVSPRDEVIDLGRRTLLPGLIDAHVHLAFSGSPTAMRDIASDSDAALVLRAVRNAEELLRAGITTVRDCGDRGNVTFELRDAIAARSARGPRVLASGMPITTRGGHCHFLGLEADKTEEVLAAVHHQAAAGADWIKIMATGGRLTPGSDPSKAQYSVEQLAAAVAEAHRLGKRVAAHALAVEGIRAAIHAGVDTIEHVSWIKGGDLDREYDEELVAESITRGTWLSVTNAHSRPQHRVMLGDPVALSPAEKAALDVYDVQLRLIARMHGAGALMIAADDAGCPDVRMGDFPLALASLAARTGIPAIDVLRMATSDAARALGIEHQVGMLEPGRRADMVAVDGDPGEQLIDLTRTVRVWKDGRVVVEDGRLT